jgi:nucleotide-binding universal stress UspA family protein
MEGLKMLQPTRILVPTDFSPDSDKALKQAFDAAKQTNAKVFVLHVIGKHIQQSVDVYSIDYRVVEDMEAQIRAAAQEKLQKQLDKFPERQGIDITTIIRNGVAYEEILKEQQKNDIDLIILASLGRTGLAKYLIGNVARIILKEAKCHVLIAKD